MAAAEWLIVFIALQIVMAVAWWRFLRTRNSDLTTAEVLLCTGILYFAQIVGTSLLLGWLGVLQRGPLLISTLLWSGVSLMLAHRRPHIAEPVDKGNAPFAVAQGERKEYFEIATPTAQAELVEASLHRKPGNDVVWLNRAMLVLFVTVSICIGLRGALSASFGWDGLKYHLPMSALMLQTHRLAFGPVHNPVIAAYPKNIEIWFHWILSFFRDDRWVDLAQVPFLWLAMVATYCMARRLGSGRASSVAGMLLLPFSPVVMTQITTAYTDVALAALLLAAIALILVAHRSGHLAVSATFGCAVGLLLGTKFSGVRFALLLLGAYAVVALRANRRIGAAVLALVCGLTLLFGGDTYARNWRLHGNPVFPYRTAVMNIEFPGVRDSNRVYGVAQTKAIHPLTRIVRSWRAVDVVSHSEIMGGFGIMWPFLAVVSIASLLVSIRRRDVARLGIFVLFSLLFLLTPLNFRVRFVIYLLGLGAVCFSHLLDRMAGAARGMLAACALLVSVFSTYQVARHELGHLKNLANSDACVRAEPAYFRDAYQWVRQNAPADSTVIVLPSGDNLFAYCLWNPRFSNRVEFAQATTVSELFALAQRQPNTFLFLPHRAAAYVAYAAQPPGPWREPFSNEHVTLATLRE